jgi:hypothetical protein
MTWTDAVKRRLRCWAMWFETLKAMPKTREEILEEQRLLKAQYGELFDAIVALLFRHDPIGINFDVNIDEYEPEAGTILPRLRTCHSPDDTLRVVYEEFVRWFDSSAGPQERYSQISNDIWQLWLNYRSKREAVSGVIER